MRDYWLSKLFFDLQNPAAAAEYRADRGKVLRRYPIDPEVRKAIERMTWFFFPKEPTPICCATSSSPPA